MEKIIAFWKKYKEENWFIILSLVLFFPVGLYLMWQYSSWRKEPKWVITAFFALLIILSPFVNDDTSESVIASNEVITQTKNENNEEKQKLEAEQEEIDTQNENLDKEKESLEKERDQLAIDTEKLEKEREKIEADKKELEEAGKKEQEENKAKESNKKDADASENDTEKNNQEVDSSSKDDKESVAKVESSELTDEEYEAILKPYMAQLITVSEDLGGFAEEVDYSGLTIRAQDLIYSAYGGFETMSYGLQMELEGKTIPTEHHSFHTELLEYDSNMLAYLQSIYEASENEDIDRIYNLDAEGAPLITQANNLIYLYPF